MHGCLALQVFPRRPYVFFFFFFIPLNYATIQIHQIVPFKISGRIFTLLPLIILNNLKLKHAALIFFKNRAFLTTLMNTRYSLYKNLPEIFRLYKAHLSQVKWILISYIKKSQRTCWSFVVLVTVVCEPSELSSSSILDVLRLRVSPRFLPCLCRLFVLLFELIIVFRIFKLSFQFWPFNGSTEALCDVKISACLSVTLVVQFI